MKKPFLFACTLMLCLAATAQARKEVRWTFTAKQIADNSYHVLLTATMNGNWHIYAQDAGDGPVSTKFTFTANPLLTLEGQPKETGKMKRSYEEVFKSEVRYYEKAVTFTQLVKVKGKVKTNLAGKVEFMLCNDTGCLPPDVLNFSVDLGS
jgi:DsbC/DsbD-like thiol-disulfide interchange protein